MIFNGIDLLKNDKINLLKFKNLHAEKKREAYELGYILYSSREYRKAACLFAHLVIANPLMDCFWRGLASCKQLLKEYEIALEAWKAVCSLQPKESLGYFHAAECYLSIENKKEALQNLDKAEQLCTDESLLNRIQLLKTIHGN
jgi:type III secretion system low calcium response chaperone LcrH/SycD